LLNEPLPCGYYNHPDKHCCCTPGQIVIIKAQKIQEERFAHLPSGEDGRGLFIATPK
jgi:hypothetical protein